MGWEMTGITKHHNSILNPDIIIDWAFEEDRLYSHEKFTRIASDRASRAKGLLPNISRYFPNEYERAERAVIRWENVSKWYKK